MMYTQKPNKLRVLQLMKGQQEGRCVLCTNVGPTSLDNLCLECTIIENTKNICYDCLHTACSSCGSRGLPLSGPSGMCPKCESTSQWIDQIHPLRRTMERCKICKMMGPSNDYGICEGCFNARNNISTCINCGNVTRPTIPGRILCKDCTKPCLSCGAHSTIATNLKDSKYCGSCAHSIASGICTDCSTYDIALDIAGKCGKCSKVKYDMIDNTTQRYFCVVCDEKEVSENRGICSDCKDQIEQCPNCHVNDMPSNQYMCNECYDNAVINYEQR